MTIEVSKQRHSVGESNFHYQITPAYRRAIFVDERVQKLVKAYLLVKAEQLGVAVVSVNYGPDHMHFFVGNCKNYSAAKLAQEFKGFISYKMRKNHKKLFEHLLWGKKFWTEGYFYRSVGRVTSETIRYYIDHSQEKHWEVVDYEFYQYSNQKTLNIF